MGNQLILQNALFFIPSHTILPIKTRLMDPLSAFALLTTFLLGLSGRTAERMFASTLGKTLLDRLQAEAPQLQDRFLETFYLGIQTYGADRPPVPYEQEAARGIHAHLIHRKSLSNAQLIKLFSQQGGSDYRQFLQNLRTDPTFRQTLATRIVGEMLADLKRVPPERARVIVEHALTTFGDNFFKKMKLQEGQQIGLQSIWHNQTLLEEIKTLLQSQPKTVETIQHFYLQAESVTYNERVIYQTGKNIVNANKIGGNVTFDNRTIIHEEQTTLPHRFTAVPSPPDIFVGREQVMQDIHLHLSDHKTLLLVSGIGGIGKTAIAETYAATQPDQYNHIAWLHHITDLPQAFINSLKNMPADWALQADEPPQAYAQRMLHKMANIKGKNLLVIDGWDDLEEINSYRTHLNLPNWTLLITTRTQAAALPRYDIGILNEADALQLFVRYAPKAEGDAQLPELLELIGYHTLMIELLAKTMNASFRLKTAQQIIDKLEQKQLADTQLQRLIEVRHHPTEVRLYAHLLHTFALTQPTDIERQLLLAFAVLPPLAISIENLFAWLQIEEKEEQAWEESLNQLAKKGWIEYTQNQDYQAHPVIQTALRYQLMPNVDNCRTLLNSFIRLLRGEDIDNKLDKAFYIPYALALLNHFNNQNHDVATLANNLASIYQALGNLPQALVFQLKALDIDKAIFGSEHSYLANSYNNLSVIYKRLGSLSKALSYQQRAIDIYEAMFEPEYLSLAISYNNLAAIYQDLGDLAQALIFQLKALRIMETFFDSERPIIATYYNNISLIYRDLGKLSQALVFQQKAVEIREQVLSPQHPDITQSYNSLSLIYKDLGELPKALAFQLKAVEIDETIFEPLHPSLAISYSNLALIYEALKELPKALVFQLKAVNIRKIIFAPWHSSLAISYNNLASIYLALGDFLQALNFQQKTIEIEETIFESKHPDLATSYNNLSGIYMSLGNFPEALFFQQKSLGIQEAIYDPQHPSLATSYWNMAGIYVNLGDWQTAKGYMDRAIAIFQYNFPNGHPSLTNALTWQVYIDKRVG